ncbi:two-component system, OmpR family, response regulator [Paracoccus aminovorans]|uniref:Two-component system, OmpR family, response regulator n=1 Tax=Paracoccus aminovorans TaxID=34004 RepID=A0A1I3EVW1_9RHOB|nr:response regulator transcription factor [Paracoccus aminovorans]CQR86893.1 two component transcriptional regulator, winged helix family [Paracoccus aminovorans]SFI03073.1 two-component system, OmpR family, response regulator [Paracoccus aminovorans]
MRLLVVEDEPDLAEAVGAYLRAAGHAVDLAEGAEDAAAALAATDYDLLLLDLGLPDGDGLSLLRGLRGRGARVPVLIVTARDRITERIAGLEAGADDYLVKPYDLDEMHARILAIHRRAAGTAEIERRFGRLLILPERRQVLLDGGPVHLTLREWALIERLSRRPDVTTSRAQMEDALYGFGDEVESNAIEAHVSRLRAKLGRDAIVTERGFGYRMGRI